MQALAKEAGSLCGISEVQGGRRPWHKYSAGSHPSIMAQALNAEETKHLLLCKFSRPESLSAFVCDEAQSLRCRGGLYHACALLSKASVVSIALTATPFFTGLKVCMLLRQL
jgi:hypothetical protein